MKRINAPRISVEKIEAHTHICDLIDVEHPVFSLYSDGKRNWLYLWCDVDANNKNRWLLFPTTRSLLLKYLRCHASALELIHCAKQLILLDITESYSLDEKGNPKLDSSNRYARRVSISDVQDYLPSSSSYFDPDLTGDLDLEEEIQPHVYAVPINGTWFGKDFESLFKSYNRLYAFFYATKPRFVRTIRTRLQELLRAPWTGGFSRVNLYAKLAEQVPAIHTLKVAKLSFASPGDVEFEALPSIGESIERTAMLAIQNSFAIENATKKIGDIIGSAKLKKADLSQKIDSDIDIRQVELETLRDKCAEIACLLSIEDEIGSLRSASPNTVVFAKATASLVRQVSKITALQMEGMLDFGRTRTDVSGVNPP